MELHKYGDIISPRGSSFLYRVLGPTCPVFDRGTLPYPCCSIYWTVEEVITLKSDELWRIEHVSYEPKALPGYKSPSWRRLDNGKGVGKQFIPDGAVAWKGKPTYSVELVGAKMPTYTEEKDIFSYQEEGGYRCEPSDVLKELMENRQPIDNTTLRSIPRKIQDLRLYTEQLDPKMKQWWFKNNHSDVDVTAA